MERWMKALKGRVCVQIHLLIGLIKAELMEKVTSDAWHNGDDVTRYANA